MDDAAHEKYVQLHLDIMAYHSRVRRGAEDSLRSVKAKVGFVPRDVALALKELLGLQVAWR